MKIDTYTVNVLRNFAKINPSIIVQEGNTLKTMSPNKTIMAKAHVTTQFDKRFAIYNLDRFLSTLSLFNTPELNFGDRFVTISDDNKTTNYVYADEATVAKAPEKEINLPSTEISFTLEEAAMKGALRAAGVLGLPEIALVGKNGKAYLTALDSRNDGSHTFEYEVGDSAANYRMIFKIDNLKLLDREYEVRVSSKGISHFASKSGDVEYWIATEQGSKYGE
jgi:hypothetical protein